MPWKNGHPKPVIGLAGGIGSGKSFVADALARLGAGVIEADKEAHAVLNEPAVLAQLKTWWGPQVIRPDGTADRKAIAAIVFNNPHETGRLNGVIHPRVGAIREEKTRAMMADPNVRAVVWDVPLLFEVGLHPLCDAVLFVDAPRDVRLRRVSTTRGWTPAELDRREKMQLPLDKKRSMADYVLDNSGEGSAILRLTERVFSQILARIPPEK